MFQYLRSGATHRSGRQRLLRLAVPVAVVACIAGLATPAEAKPPTSVTQGPISVSHTTLQGTRLNYAFVQQADDIVVKGSYTVTQSGGTIDQIEIGWRGSSAPSGCVYNGGGTHSGKFTYDLGPAPALRLNQVIVNYGQDVDCNTTGWWVSNDGPVIADVVVTPSTSGSSGPTSVSGVTIAGTTTNTLVTPGTRAVVVSGSYAIGDTGGAITQIQIGWRGASLSQVCLTKNGQGSSGTFNVSLGLPPELGANFVVIDYSQNLSCKRQWWFDGELADSATVAAVYDNE